MSFFKIFIILLLFSFSACNSIPASVNSALENAGSNRAELEKVIDHYKKTKENEKLQAAYFLIENMQYKYALDGAEVRKFDVVFDILDSLHRKNIDLPIVSPIFKAKWDSIVNIYGNPNTSAAEVVEDIKIVQSDVIIENIDFAFEQWNNNKLTKSLSFKEFCTYILPYRIETERIEKWRKHLSDEYKIFRDTVKAKNRYEFAEKLYYKIADVIYPIRALDPYTYSMSVSQMEKGRRGRCYHLTSYTASVMRANGMPVGIDHIATAWGDSETRHAWNTLLLENGKHFQFEAGDSARAFSGVGVWRPFRPAKIYRRTFQIQNTELPSESVPKELVLPFDIDVTSEYTKTYDISVQLTKHFEYRKKPVVITTYGKSWIPQAIGKVKNNLVEFKNMGSNIVYMAMYYDQGQYIPASDPFILDKSGKLKYLKPQGSVRQNLKLIRKYPYLLNSIWNSQPTLGARIEGANRSDFKDAVNLFTITTLPVKFEETVVVNPKKFKYIRYISPADSLANIAELEFFGDKGSKLKGNVIGSPEVPPTSGTIYQHAFDNDLLTYFSAGNVALSWVGLHLSKPERITKIRYCPKSDTNFIIVGDTYELFFWDGEGWKSLGPQTAKNQYLTYNNAPGNALFILKNLSGSKEERIFTYEQGKQVWW